MNSGQDVLSKELRGRFPDDLFDLQDQLAISVARTLQLRLSELDQGSWVIFQLPGFNTAASGQQQDSLDALRKASETSYFKGKDALWVKVISPDSGPLGLGGGTALEVSR